MANPSPQVLTANRLRDGTVLYRKGDGWVLTLAEADIYADKPAADAALAAATDALVRNEFVAPYLFEVRRQDGPAVPVKEREVIRAAGPTVHPHTGKQAGQLPPDPARTSDAHA
ncbi:MAG: hypothetical protein BGN85_06060 [Alphaproteobacteria bacterium 64-11]|nr:DUF2849 domain-containing protein [Alphaproteobacteria bacterium]OJU11917.1 MAG: hypothetical protein BGN85_06060 [Alphaproteobacteria bacterium 64-11]